MKYLILSCLLATTGCEVLYDANRDKIGEYCNSLNNFDDRNACRKRNQTSYQQYVQQRGQQQGQQQSAAAAVK